ncbi:hypothetical protein A5641_17505 [Mycobacterium sp. 1554424.7]|nr:hypothetical protein A5641_17505 [Mycobacterium sp. 1554424.7]
MRIAVLGAVASALMGGTLAVTPLTSVSTPLPAAGPCVNGCQKAASVLMPETPPSAPGTQVAPAANTGGDVPKPAADVANVPPTPGGPGATGAVSGVPRGSSGGGAPSSGAASPGGFDSGLPDAAASVLPQLPGALDNAAAIQAAPAGAQAAWSIVQGVVGVGTTVVGVGTSVVATASTAAIALVYLKNAGLLPPGFTLGIPNIAVPQLPGTTAAAAAAVPGAAAGRQRRGRGKGRGRRKRGQSGRQSPGNRRQRGQGARRGRQHRRDGRRRPRDRRRCRRYPARRRSRRTPRSARRGSVRSRPAHPDLLAA